MMMISDETLKVYHYTNLDSFMKMMDEGSNPGSLHLRFTQISDLIDPTEFNLALRWFLARSKVSEPYYGIYESQLGQTKTYVFCCSKLGDYFPLWQLYGDSGRGVCICFEVNRDCDKDDTLLCRDVIYGDEPDHPSIEMALSVIHGLPEDHLNLPLTHKAIRNELLTCKLKCFEHEEEYRFIRILPDYDPYMDWEINNNRIRSYTYFHAHDSAIICPHEIILGPLLKDFEFCHLEMLIRKKSDNSLRVIPSQHKTNFQ